jgi:hypothetical protein
LRGKQEGKKRGETNRQKCGEGEVREGRSNRIEEEEREAERLKPTHVPCTS